MTAQEAIRNALDRLAWAAQQSDGDYPDDNMVFAMLPVAEIAQSGFTVEVLDDDDADVLPRVQVQNAGGRVLVERCPFAPLVLLSEGDGPTGEGLIHVLQECGIAALTLDDLQSAPDWHGVSVASWLFPQRLSEVLSRLDDLRGEARP